MANMNTGSTPLSAFPNRPPTYHVKKQTHNSQDPFKYDIKSTYTSQALRIDMLSNIWRHRIRIKAYTLQTPLAGDLYITLVKEAINLMHIVRFRSPALESRIVQWLIANTISPQLRKIWHAASPGCLKLRSIDAMVNFVSDKARFTPKLTRQLNLVFSMIAPDGISDHKSIEIYHNFMQNTELSNSSFQIAHSLIMLLFNKPYVFMCFWVHICFPQETLNEDRVIMHCSSNFQKARLLLINFVVFEKFVKSIDPPQVWNKYLPLIRLVHPLGSKTTRKTGIIDFMNSIHAEKINDLKQSLSPSTPSTTTLTTPQVTPQATPPVARSENVDVSAEYNPESTWYDPEKPITELPDSYWVGSPPMDTSPNDCAPDSPPLDLSLDLDF